MDHGLRFIHTADWQIGMRAGHIPDDDGAAVRNARFEVVERIAVVARDAGAHFVVVAGDVFEHHALHRENTQRTFEALRAFTCPVFLLPGNHDPYTPDALYRTDWWARECPAGVTVLGRREVHQTPQAALLPCPLTERHMHNPTSWLDSRPGPRDCIRVGVAHGGVPEFLAGRVAPEEMENDIPLGLAERAGLDYLALGDWHSHSRVNERTWYSGTPESTRFEEKEPGYVLSVSLTGPQAVPSVEPVRVGRFAWRTLERTLVNGDDVQALENELASMPSRSTTLLQMVLLGQLDLALHARATVELASRYRGSFRHLRFRTDALLARLSEDDLASLPQGGWVGRMVQRLREGRVEGLNEAACQRALHELHKIHLETSRNGGGR